MGSAIIAIPAMQSRTPSTVVILYNNATLARYPLNENRTCRINAALGPMDIAITNGTAKVVYSTCPQHICMRTGSIHTTGQQIVCAPNHIIIEICSAQKDGIDAVSR